ncbi:MAG: ABC transporter permease [Rhodobacteraceae bacterium]|nr:ABC transporter permease [Paracoccaceae bacterium]
MTDTSFPAQSPRKFKTGRTIMALILREMATTYGKSPGGYIWAVLQPIGALAVFTLVIAIGLKIRTPSLGTSFMLFYATGHLPYSLFNETSGKVSRAIRFSRQLLRYPGVRYSDAIIARFLLNLLTHIMVFYVVMTGIHIAFGLQSILHVPSILRSFAMTAALGLGVGTLNCFLMAKFPIWVIIWNILTRPLFLLSTVIYTFEQIPWRYQDVLWYNPLVHVVGMMRRGFYPTYEAAYVSEVYVYGVSVICLVMGLVFLNRHYREFLNN